MLHHGRTPSLPTAWDTPTSSGRVGSSSNSRPSRTRASSIDVDAFPLRPCKFSFLHGMSLSAPQTIYRPPPAVAMGRPVSLRGPPLPSITVQCEVGPTARNHHDNGRGGAGGSQWGEQRLGVPEWEACAATAEDLAVEQAFAEEDARWEAAFWANVERTRGELERAKRHGALTESKLRRSPAPAAPAGGVRRADSFRHDRDLAGAATGPSPPGGGASPPSGMLRRAGAKPRVPTATKKRSQPPGNVRTSGSGGGGGPASGSSASSLPSDGRPRVAVQQQQQQQQQQRGPGSSGMHTKPSSPLKPLAEDAAALIVRSGTHLQRSDSLCSDSTAVIERDPQTAALATRPGTPPRLGEAFTRAGCDDSDPEDASHRGVRARGNTSIGLTSSGIFSSQSVLMHSEGSSDDDELDGVVVRRDSQPHLAAVSASPEPFSPQRRPRPIARHGAGREVSVRGSAMPPPHPPELQHQQRQQYALFWVDVEELDGANDGCSGDDWGLVRLVLLRSPSALRGDSSADENCTTGAPRKLPADGGAAVRDPAAPGTGSAAGAPEGSAAIAQAGPPKESGRSCCAAM